MKKTLFVGAGVAIVTPFNDNGSVNYDALANMLDYQIENSTDAIIICGTTGEASTLTDEEQISVVKFTVDKVNGRIPVIAGAGSNDTAHGINLCKECEAVGADGLLIVTPYYNKTTQRGLVKYYTDMAGSVKIPVIMYSVAGRTGVNIAPETAAVLSEVDNIVAIKEASGNISQVAKIAALCSDKLDIYSGNDDMIVPLLSLGGKGVISVLSNVAPKYTHDMVRSFIDGETTKAARMQLDALELINALFCEVNPIPVKAALNMMGMKAGGYRAPLIEPSEESCKKIENAMKNFKLI
ncbi:MAG TPA: 4-hydroxy-tetrahydrodipicolinate synthase [Lachnospiraceae bacterium]|nr:4-hydroxy-tetrahydrodipicolinate synthase [Lachnospiraceae bacterium]